MSAWASSNGSAQAAYSAAVAAASAQEVGADNAAQLAYDASANAADMQWDQAMAPAYQALWDAQADDAQAYANTVATAYQAIWDAQADDAQAYANTVATAYQALWDAQADDAQAYVTTVAPAAQTLGDAQADDAQAYANTVTTATQSLNDALAGDAQTLGDAQAKAAKAAADAQASAGQTLGNAISSDGQAAVSSATSAAKSLNQAQDASSESEIQANVAAANSSDSSSWSTFCEIASAAAGGLVTGMKAVVNGSASALVSTVTLGTYNAPVEPWAVNQGDLDNGYGTAVQFAKAGSGILIGTLGPGAVSSVFKGTQYACVVGKGLVLFDAASNVSGGIQSGYDILQNGFTLENVLGLAGSALGLAGNAAAWKNIGCFAAGTPILTPNGSTPIEELRVGDWVLSKPDDDPEAVPMPRRIVELFHNYLPLLNLEIGGRIIRTTAEHPFWVRGRGWTAAHQMMAGDHLLTHDGRWAVLASVSGAHDTESVYNVQVDDYHTYFVGGGLWGFAVWSHNISCSEAADDLADVLESTLKDGETGVVAVLQTTMKNFEGLSNTLGGSSTLHATVIALLKRVPAKFQVSPFFGECAELEAISEALTAGATLKGARMAVRNVGGANHGTMKGACGACQWIMGRLGIIPGG